MPAKKLPQPEGTPEIEVFKDDGEPGSTKQSIGLVIHNATIYEHKEGQLVPAIRMTTAQARDLIKTLFVYVVQIDGNE